MKPPDLPTLSEKDFESFHSGAKNDFVVLRATCEMWKAIALRQEPEILELKAEIKALKEENAQLRERVAQLEAQLRQNSYKEAHRQFRELLIYRKVSLCIRSVIGRRYVESIFSVVATCKLHNIKPLEYLKTSIESFRFKIPAPVLIPG